MFGSGALRRLRDLLRYGTTPVGPSIATPLIAQTSANGISPFTWRTVSDPTFQPGFYWHVQRASSVANLLAGTLNGEAIQMITTQDLASGSTTFPALGTTPDGPLAMRERVGREDGLGGYVWSDWANVLTDTITSLPANVTFDPTKRRTSGSPTSLSNNNLTVTGVDAANSPANIMVTAAKVAGSASNNRAYVEYLIGTTTGTAGIRSIGFVASDFAVTTNAVPGASGQPGISWRSDGNIYRSAGTINATGSTTYTDGDVIGAYIDVDQGRAWFHKNGAWLIATGSPETGAGLPLNITGAVYANAAPFRNTPITLRATAASQAQRGTRQPWGQ